jgi:hypothetical protein
MEKAIVELLARRAGLDKALAEFPEDVAAAAEQASGVVAIAVAAFAPPVLIPRFARDSLLEQSGFELWVPPACDAPGSHKVRCWLLDWRLKENAKADVRQTIREEYDELPEVYDRRLWEDKVERTFQFMFERYSGEIAAPPK